MKEWKVTFYLFCIPWLPSTQGLAALVNSMTSKTSEGRIQDIQLYLILLACHVKVMSYLPSDNHYSYFYAREIAFLCLLLTRGGGAGNL
jgi:hypothetical protein